MWRRTAYGFDRLTKKKKAATAKPTNVICVSPCSDDLTHAGCGVPYKNFHIGGSGASFTESESERPSEDGGSRPSMKRSDMLKRSTTISQGARKGGSGLRADWEVSSRENLASFGRFL